MVLNSSCLHRYPLNFLFFFSLINFILKEFHSVLLSLVIKLSSANILHVKMKGTKSDRMAGTLQQRGWRNYRQVISLLSSHL